MAHLSGEGVVQLERVGQFNRVGAVLLGAQQGVGFPFRHPRVFLEVVSTQQREVHGGGTLTLRSTIVIRFCGSFSSIFPIKSAKSGFSSGGS